MEQDSTLRVKSQKITKIMDMVGELGLVAAEVINHHSLSHLKKERDFVDSVHRLELLIRELQDESSGLRLVPVGSVFQRMQRLARDLVRQTGKSFELKLEGIETEVDKVIVDALYDPLVHLVRNAADHGIETPELRQAAGKQKKGTISLSALQQGSEFLIKIQDDGQGMKRDKIIQRAIDNGLINADEPLEDSAVWALIFEPGFSTNDEVSTLSGRGVGMNVVKTTITHLRGHISVDSQPGKGSTVTLYIPLTLAFLDCMIIRIENCLYAISIDAISDVLKVKNDTQISNASSDDNQMLNLRDHLIPIRYLQQFYKIKHLTSNIHTKTLMVVKTHSNQFAIPIDEVLGQQQVTIKPLQGALTKIRAASGCALLSSGDVAIVLDCEQLLLS